MKREPLFIQYVEDVNIIVNHDTSSVYLVFYNLKNKVVCMLKNSSMGILFKYFINSFLVNWQISNPPIVFGQDVVLFCNTSLAENCCTNTATWMKGFDVIVHHGTSTDYSKYIQEKKSYGFLLIIKNFDEEDINQQYTCLYDFFSYSAVLRIDRHNFKCKYI